MKKQRFTEGQIMQILKAEGGIPVADLCREYGMSTVVFVAVVSIRLSGEAIL